MITIVYILSLVLFVFGVNEISSPKTSYRGNILAMTAILISIMITLFDRKIHDFSFIIASSFIGSTISVVTVKKAKLSAMPQMVAFYNGLGGGATVFVAVAEYYHMVTELQFTIIISIVLGLLIGIVLLTGSLVVYAKLQNYFKSAPAVFEIKHSFHLLLFTFCIIFCVIISVSQTSGVYLMGFFVVSSALGVLIVVPIGGANMPVVTSLLISYSGLAAAASGFIVSNNILFLSGTAIGVLGIILTLIKCKALYRSSIDGAIETAKVNVLEDNKKIEKPRVIAYTPEDAVMILDDVQSIIIIPGHGLAVAQAQYILHTLEKALIKKGARVRYAIHPLAGHMPEHMNTLLAEAHVPHELLFDLDTINDDFQNTDVALVVGANDIINRAACTVKNCPLYDTQILNADKARAVIVCKRSLKPGFSGMDNKLFYNPKTLMIFGDAKESITEMVKLLNT